MAEENASKTTTQSEQPLSQVNRYTMSVDINGFKYNQKDGINIKYTEISDYWNNKYPVRILQIEIPFKDVHAILYTEKNKVNNREMYDINVLVSPLDNQGFQNKPFVDGMFKAILKDGDIKNDFSEEIKPDSRMANRELGVIEVPLVFYLYKEEELKYSQTDFNLVMNNPTLSQAWVTGFSRANPNLKAIVSKFEHNPTMGMLIIPPTGYPDYLEYLEDEAGFFSTKYMDYIEHGVYFLLNRNNNVNVKCANLEFTITLNVARKLEDRTDQYIRKLDDFNYEMSVSANDVKVTISNDKSFGNTTKYVPPSGQGARSDRGLSRNMDLVYKTTEVQHITKLENPIYELVEINMNNNSVNFVTPLTKFSLMDSAGKPRTYRVAGKQTTVQAGQWCTTKLRGFRLIENS